jgi:hypothetical protein
VLIAVRHEALTRENPGPGRTQSLVVPGVLGKTRRIGHEACTRATAGSAPDATVALPEVVGELVVGVLARWLPAQPDAANATVARADSNGRQFISVKVRHGRSRCHTAAWASVPE